MHTHTHAQAHTHKHTHTFKHMQARANTQTNANSTNQTLALGTMGPHRCDLVPRFQSKAQRVAAAKRISVGWSEWSQCHGPVYLVAGALWTVGGKIPGALLRRTWRTSRRKNPSLQSGVWNQGHYWISKNCMWTGEAEKRDSSRMPI